MSTLTFDTLKYANTLKEAGVPEVQAEAQAEALSSVLEVNLQDLVTKQDLRHELELLRRDMSAMEQRLTIKMGVMMAASITIVAVLVKLL